MDGGLATAFTPGVTSGSLGRHIKGLRFWERASCSLRFQRSSERYSKPAFQYAEMGLRKETRPSRQKGLRWVLTVTCGLGQVSAPLSLSFPIRKKLGFLSSLWTRFWGSILFLPLLVPLILKNSLVH